MKQGRNESAKKNESGDVNSDLKQGQDVCFTVQTLHLQGEAHTAAIPIQQDNITGEASDTAQNRVTRKL